MALQSMIPLSKETTPGNGVKYVTMSFNILSIHRYPTGQTHSLDLKFVKSRWSTLQNSTPSKCIFNRCYLTDNNTKLIEPMIIRSQAICSHSMTAPQGPYINMQKYTKLIRAPLRVIMSCKFRSFRVGRTTGYCR